MREADWLQERFPEAELRDVEGLVKLVDRSEIEAHDWSLTPGRYVGVAPEKEDEDFDFEEALRSIHIDLQELNEEAIATRGHGSPGTSRSWGCDGQESNATWKDVVAGSFCDSRARWHSMAFSEVCRRWSFSHHLKKTSEMAGDT